MNRGPLVLGDTGTECIQSRGLNLNNRGKRDINDVKLKISISKTKIDWTKTR